MQYTFAAEASRRAVGADTVPSRHTLARPPALPEMIKHIVMWKVRGETQAERRDNSLLLQREFESLRGRVPGLLSLEVGVDHSRIDYACDVVLVSDFESQAALDAYATNPEHLRVRRAVGDLRIARHQVDYAVERSPT